MEEKKEGAGCGLKCGCCTCKTVRGAVLLILGGVIGFFIGRCGSMSRMCPMPAAGSAAQYQSAPAAAPAAAAKKAK